MAKLDASTIEKYQAILAKDPSNQVFAPLAEAYREMGLLKEAEKMAKEGVRRHPHFVSGLVTLAKILKDLESYQEALNHLKKALTLASENILAHQLCGEIQLALRQPKEALKHFKMILFLNPQSQSAKKAVQKLESLTADEYDDELFQMARISQVKGNTATPTAVPRIENSSTEISSTTSPLPKGMERMLSLIDAFIVRNDLEKAQLLIQDCVKEFGSHAELQKRQRSLKSRSSSTEDLVSATPLKPLTPRTDSIKKKKIETLELLLRRIDDYRAGL